MPRTILIFVFGDLGDAILTAPAIRAIRDRQTSARLVLVCKHEIRSLIEDLGLVDDVVEVDKHAFDRVGSIASLGALAKIGRLIARLRAERADTVVLFHHLVTRWGALKFALLALATGAPQRLGLDNGRGWFLTRRVRDLGFGACHESEYWMQVAGLLGARDTIRLSVPIGEDDRRHAVALLSAAGCAGRRLIAIHAGTGWYGPGRQWPAERFAHVAEEIIAGDGDFGVLVVGTEQDRLASQPVLDRLGSRVCDLIGKTSVGELCAALQECSLLIANDGGVAHLAAAAGTRVLTIFGPSNDAAWKPLGSDVIAADLPCRPCFYRDFERGLPAGCATRECLALVTAETVASRAIDILSFQEAAAQSVG